MTPGRLHGHHYYYGPEAIPRHIGLVWGAVIRELQRGPCVIVGGSVVRREDIPWVVRKYTWRPDKYVEIHNKCGVEPDIRPQPSALKEKLEQDPLHYLQETPAAKLDHANFVEHVGVGGDAKGEEAAEGSSVCAA